MFDRRAHILAAAVLLLASCSSRPREFEPTLQAVPADQAAYDQHYETCRTLVAQGQRSNFGPRIASGGVGAAAAVGVGAAAFSGTAGSIAATAAAASAAAVMMPVVGIGAAWGMAKARKARKERDIKRATALCLSEQGYAVSDWKVAKRGRRAAAAASSPAQ